MFENFHFIEPLWLLALIPLLLLVWRGYRLHGGDNPWSRIVDARLLPLLLVGRPQSMSYAAFWLAAAGWSIAVLALADPTWERTPLPVYQTTAARVIVLEMAGSMNATDLKPSRAVRARYKVEDVLAQRTEGQTGLVVYAGDAFTVTPLTRDVNTIRALLKVLDPGIMPIDGERADLGLLKAGELLREAGATSGEELLIADGIAPDNLGASERAAARLKNEGYRVSVLGVGTKEGAPLTNANGQQVRDAAGKIVISKLEPARLRATASAGGGNYQSISDSGRALSALLSDSVPPGTQLTTQPNVTTQRWKEQGPLLAVFLLPLAALAFRRNWLLSLVLLAGLLPSPQPAMASTWDDLWQRPDQQAAKAFDAGDYARASALARDANRRGSAEYKRGNYQLALDNFLHAQGPDADYNRGNALAKLGRYKDAISAYDKALEKNPADADARANKAAVEALLKQQKQQPQQQKSQLQKSAAQGDKSQQPHTESNGAGQNSLQGQSPNQAPKDGKRAQAGASSEQGQKSAETNKSKKGSEGSKSSTAPSTAQVAKSGNQFAQAAKKLAENHASAKSDLEQQSPGALGGNTDAPEQAASSEHKRAGATGQTLQPLDTEEQLAAEQWLRRIPDDPGGLLRRKFLYQYRQRAKQSEATRL